MRPVTFLLLAITALLTCSCGGIDDGPITELNRDSASRIIERCQQSDPRFGTESINGGKMKVSRDAEGDTLVAKLTKLAQGGLITFDSLPPQPITGTQALFSRAGAVDSRNRYYELAFTPAADPYISKTSEDGTTIVRTYEYVLEAVETVQEVPAMGGAVVKASFTPKPTPFYSVESKPVEGNSFSKELAFRKTADDGWILCDPSKKAG